MTEYKICRVCYKPLKLILDLGEQHLQGRFPNKEERKHEYKYPLRLMKCENCNLVQLSHTVDKGLMFREYWYRSGISDTMRYHLMSLSNQCMSMIDTPYPKILDIGCNDGTFLSYFSSFWDKTGIDPCNVNLLGYKDFYPSKFLVNQTYDLITTIACFYDVNDPVTFAKAVYNNLTPDGIWCIEVADLEGMIENTAYDAICFEHLMYYNIQTLKSVLELAGFKIIKKEHNKSNGNSIRVYAAKNKSKYHATHYNHRETNILTLNAFVKSVQRSKEELKSFISGKRVHVLGASTKGNTLLQYCELNSIEAASERDSKKHGRFTPGTNIPIISEEESRARKPDYYLVLPWHFKEEIIEREKNSGVKLIFPLPKLTII